MIQICDRAYHKNTDTYTMSEIGIPGIVLMERAAYELVQQVPLTESKRILAVCGSGNNGGDGIAAARILHQRGYFCDVLLLCGKHALTELAEQELEIAKKAGVRVYGINDDGFPGMDTYDVILDAIFGIGLAREISEPYKAIIEEINASAAYVVAADIPSGIDTDTGAVLGIAVKADVTVSFGYGKPGLYLYPGAEYAGRVEVKEIGFVDPGNADYCMFAYESIEEYPFVPRSADSHKGSYGKVLIIAGFDEMSGACCMAAEAAYRSGAGLVRVFTSENSKRVLQVRVPELMVSSYEKENWEAELMLQLQWADVIAIGPGLGTGKRANRALELLLSVKDKKYVLDADAINLLNGELSRIPYGAVLTPHPAELSRLLQLPIAEIKKDRIGVLKKYITRNDIVCVCKDARTIIAQGTSFCINLNGNSGMATGGSGDVLTGITVAMLASGMKPFDAACAAVRIHAEAGDMIASRLSEHSMLATDMVTMLHDIFQVIEDIRQG